MVNTNRKIVILSCRSGRIFAERICEHLKGKYGYESVLGNIRIKEFANKEINPTIEESVRGKSIYIVQNIDDPNSDRKPQENFDELLNLIDAARRSVGINGSVSVVMPNYYKARQHKSTKRESIAARMTADILKNAGANAILCIDIHDEAIAGYFTDVKFDNLHASGAIIDYLRRELFDFINYEIEENGEKICGFSVASPDVGSAKKAKYYAKILKSGLIICAKFRDEDKPNAVDKILLLGDVNGNNIFVVDDMIDTGGTIKEILYELKKNNAKDIYVGCTHPIFSGPAIERLTELYNKGIIKGVIGTDTVIHENKPEWYHEVSVAPLFGDVIYRIENNMSVSDII